MKNRKDWFRGYKMCFDQNKKDHKGFRVEDTLRLFLNHKELWGHRQMMKTIMIGLNAQHFGCDSHFLRLHLSSYLYY